MLNITYTESGVSPSNAANALRQRRLVQHDDVRYAPGVELADAPRRRRRHNRDPGQTQFESQQSPQVLQLLLAIHLAFQHDADAIRCQRVIERKVIPEKKNNKYEMF